MSAPVRSKDKRLALSIPHAWQRFLRSGQYAGARASLRAGGSEVPVELVARLEFVDDGHMAIDLELAERSPAVSSEQSLVDLLTARERSVITLIATGLETQQIAEALHVSPSTVRTHVRNSMAKVGAHTRAHLVAVAMAGQEQVPVGHPAGQEQVPVGHPAGQEQVPVGHPDDGTVDKSTIWSIDQASRQVDR
jgi:DNA-binding CsgD family transcriptional regulator